ncbi:MAG: DJ-1/PfpI family protein [Micropepsaceae bacterium]
MDNTRRTLLGGMAAIAPLLYLHQAMAANSGDQSAMPHGHDASANLPNFRMHGDEQIAMLLYPKFTALDLVAPHYFFACMMGAKVHLVTKSRDLAPVPSDLGLAITPTVSMTDCPANLTAIFAPGGTEGTVGAMMDAETMDFVADRGSRAHLITSVCTGSLILGQAGLLKGKRATSHWAARDSLKLFGATPVNKRIVTDGNVITGAGVSAGLDFALAVVALLRGAGYAEALRLQAEYAPEPPVPGGTLETTSPPLAKLMSDMLLPFTGMVAKAAAVKR